MSPFLHLRQWFDRHIVVPKTRYRLTEFFSGTVGPINSLVFLNDRLLVSGGDDQRVNIWDINTRALYQKLDDRTNRWGHITCITAATVQPSQLRFICGTGRSQVVIFCQSQENGDFEEVDCIKAFDGGNFTEALAFDNVHKRLAVTSHHGDLVIYQVNDKGILSKCWSQHLGSIIPRAIHFMEQGEKIVAYSLYKGDLATFDVETRQAEDRLCLQTQIGNLDYYQPKKLILVDNIDCGFDVYPIGRTATSKRFLVPRREALVIMAKFAEGGSFVVTGSDHGTVYVFHLGTMQKVQMLYHGGKTNLIQTVATRTTSKGLGEHIIASASSSEKSSICIWRRPVLTQRPQSTSPHSDDVPISSAIYRSFLSVLHTGFIAIASVVVFNALNKWSTLSAYIGNHDLRASPVEFLTSVTPLTISTTTTQIQETTGLPITRIVEPEDGSRTVSIELVQPLQSPSTIKGEVWLETLAQADEEQLDAITNALERVKRRHRKVIPLHAN